MLTMIEVVMHINKTSLVRITISFDELEQFNLIKSLIHVVFII